MISKHLYFLFLQVVGHQIILGIASPILRDIFVTSHNNYDDVIHISFPDVSHFHLTQFVESIYLGGVPTSTEVFESWKYLVRVNKSIPKFFCLFIDFLQEMCFQYRGIQRQKHLKLDILKIGFQIVSLSIG